ncbi:MAG: CsbD family protein [Corynebacterium sp.]|nr:CsbD family protein [Corynebacterium sp.]
MSEFDKIKGKAQEAVGKITGDENLEDQGKAEQVKSEATERVKDGVNKVIGSFKKD